MIAINSLDSPASPPHAPASHAIDAIPSPLRQFVDEYVLGTRLQILVNSHSATLANEAALAARREIERLDGVFNTRRSDSEISLLNRMGFAQASPDLFAVVQLSEQWRLITHGAFDGRMSELLMLWSNESPNRGAMESALSKLSTADVKFDATRRIELSNAALSLDAVAKGYIVDAALNAARRAAPTIAGAAVCIGGDLRCFGDSNSAEGWRVGIPDPRNPAENAPLVDAVQLRNAAIATSGRGPRDCIHDRYRSTTISPLTGLPVRDVMSASVIASHAADADAVATACLVLSPAESLALAERLDGVAVRITDAQGGVHLSRAWPQYAAATPAKSGAKSAVQTPPAGIPALLPQELKWPADWELGINYIAPERKENERSSDFRTPYMALWITDARDRPVTTPIMIGRDPDWQHDNFIWWGSYGARAEQLIELRSQATTLSGRYRIFWSGVDDNWKPLPLGKYTLHLETSQERGKHHYRSIELDIGHDRFKKTLPNVEGSGGIEITYGHYNDRFKSDD